MDRCGVCESTWKPDFLRLIKCRPSEMGHVINMKNALQVAWEIAFSPLDSVEGSFFCWQWWQMMVLHNLPLSLSETRRDESHIARLTVKTRVRINTVMRTVLNYRNCGFWCINFSVEFPIIIGWISETTSGACEVRRSCFEFDHRLRLSGHLTIVCWCKQRSTIVPMTWYCHLHEHPHYIISQGLLEMISRVMLHCNTLQNLIRSSTTF